MRDEVALLMELRKGRGHLMEKVKEHPALAKALGGEQRTPTFRV
jgi:hypothetical protein